MATLIDISYFYGSRAIAQADDPAVAATVQEFINEYEARYLQELLGPLLYTDFVNGLAASEPPARYVALKEGIEFVNRDGAPRKWMGFVYVLNGFKKSP